MHFNKFFFCYMNRLRDNRILIYAFFQLFVLSASRFLIPPLIPLISLELKVGLDFIGTVIALNIFAIFFVSIITGNIIEIIGLKKVLYIGILINFCCHVGNRTPSSINFEMQQILKKIRMHIYMGMLQND